MTEAAKLALASFLSEIWETRYTAPRSTGWTKEGDDDPPSSTVMKISPVKGHPDKT
jgi:hypothetical protein